MLTWAAIFRRPSNEGQTMKYMVLKSCVAGGTKRNAGEIVELGADEAASLMSYGRIGVAPEPKPQAASTNRAAKPKTTRKKKNED